MLPVKPKKKSWLDENRGLVAGLAAGAIPVAGYFLTRKTGAKQNTSPQTGLSDTTAAQQATTPVNTSPQTGLSDTTTTPVNTSPQTGLSPDMPDLVSLRDNIAASAKDLSGTMDRMDAAGVTLQPAAYQNQRVINSWTTGVPLFGTALGLSWAGDKAKSIAPVAGRVMHGAGAVSGAVLDADQFISNTHQTQALAESLGVSPETAAKIRGGLGAVTGALFQAGPLGRAGSAAVNTVDIALERWLKNMATDKYVNDAGARVSSEVFRRALTAARDGDSTTIKYIRDNFPELLTNPDISEKGRQRLQQIYAGIQP